MIDWLHHLMDPTNLKSGLNYVFPILALSHAAGPSSTTMKQILIGILIQSVVGITSVVLGVGISVKLIERDIVHVKEDVSRLEHRHENDIDDVERKNEEQDSKLYELRPIRTIPVH